MLWIVVLSRVQHHPNSRSFRSHLITFFPYTMHATRVCPGMGNSECHCEPHDIWWTAVFCVPQQFQFLQRPEIPQNHPMEKLMAILQVCPSYKPPFMRDFPVMFATSTLTPGTSTPSARTCPSLGPSPAPVKRRRPVAQWRWHRRLHHLRWKLWRCGRWWPAPVAGFP